MQEKIDDLQVFMINYRNRKETILNEINQRIDKLFMYEEILDKGFATKNYSATMQDFLRGIKGNEMIQNMEDALLEIQRKIEQLREQVIDVDKSIRILNNQYDDLQWELRKCLASEEG